MGSNCWSGLFGGGHGGRFGFVLQDGERLGFFARRLHFVEGGFGAVHAVLGGGAGAVDGGLGGEVGGVDHGVGGGVVGTAGFVLGGLEAGDDFAEGFFGHGAAAETPGVADEFGGGDFFDGVGGGEGGPESGTEVFVVFLFFGLDAVVGGEEAEFGVIAGGFGFAFSVLGPVEDLAFSRLALI